jgi:hypothetical protein
MSGLKDRERVMSNFLVQEEKLTFAIVNGGKLDYFSS